MISPEHIMWLIDLSNIESPYQLFSKKTGKKLRAALKKMKESQYKFKIEPATEEVMGKFEVPYKKNIETKDSGNVFDVRKNINERQKLREYLSLSLYKNNLYIGGLIFSNREDAVFAAYKVFPKFLVDLKLPINLSFMAEYYFFKFAIENKKSYIKHGKDRNIFGINANPGLAMFKMQVSCKPYVSKKNKQFLEFNPPIKNKRDVIVFHGKNNEEKIKNASLYLYKSTIEEATIIYGALLKSDIETKIINKI